MARSALRRARRDQLFALVLLVSASLRLRAAKRWLHLQRSVWRWRGRVRKRLRRRASGALRLGRWLG